MTLIDRNSRTSSSDFIYLILLRFFSPSSPSFLYSPRYFFANFSFTSFPRCSWLLIMKHAVSFSLPPPLSFCLSHMRTCDGATTAMDEKGLELRFLRPVWLHRGAWREPCCTEGKDYHPCSEPSGELFFTYRFTSVHGPANGPSQTNHRPTNRCGFLIPRLYKCHPSVPTCNRVHHSWKLLSATNTTTLLVYLPTIALNPYVTKTLIYEQPEI